MASDLFRGIVTLSDSGKHNLLILVYWRVKADAGVDFLQPKRDKKFSFSEVCITGLAGLVITSSKKLQSIANE